ncbi:MAG: DUF2398 family protein [Pseudomonadota bacterium]|nr:DUF2398 family protein [Pseudomonadota bacterium]
MSDADDLETDASVEAAGPPSTGMSELRRRRRWTPEVEADVASVLRLLVRRAWLISGRDDDAIRTIRRNASSIRDTLSRLGWGVVIERDFVRLRKSPPVRREAWAAEGPAPLYASWFFLFVAASEGMPPKVGLGQLVASARAAAAEAGLSVVNDIKERQAIVGALKLLDERGIIVKLDGEIERFVDDEDTPALLEVHHKRLAHVIANFSSTDPAVDPEGWLASVEREPDAARRVRRRLVDDTLVYSVDLDDTEADWLSRRVRGDDGGPLAEAFGLHLERRAEGAAFVVPHAAFRHLHELGPVPFPGTGTIAHAALLLCEHARENGIQSAEEAQVGPTWRCLTAIQVLTFLERAVQERPQGRGGWREEFADGRVLMEQVRERLCALDLLRLTEGGVDQSRWWFSPATNRWTRIDERSAVERKPRKAVPREQGAPGLFAGREGGS